MVMHFKLIKAYCILFDYHNQYLQTEARGLKCIVERFQSSTQPLSFSSISALHSLVILYSLAF